MLYNDLFVAYKFPRGIPGIKNIKRPGEDFLITSTLMMYPDLDQCPILGYYLNGSLIHLENFQPPSEWVSLANNKGLHIVLFEPMCLYMAEHTTVPDTTYYFNMGFYSEFTGFEECKDIRSIELDSISLWAKRHGVNNITVHTCDYNAAEQLPHYNKDLNVIYDNVFLKTQVIDPSLKNLDTNKSIEYSFIMRNWRWSPHRCVMTSLLQHHSSIISWTFRNSMEVLMDTPWLKSLEQHSLYPEIATGLDKLNACSPFTIDLICNQAQDITVNTGHHYPETVEVYGRDHHPRNNEGVKETLTGAYQKSFVDLCAETRFAQPTGNYSEKSMMSCLYRTPFILAASPGSLAAMKSLGFKSFDDWWCEDYDTETDHLKRVSMIYDLICEIDSWGAEKQTRIYAEMSGVLEHNHALSVKHRLQT